MTSKIGKAIKDPSKAIKVIKHRLLIYPKMRKTQLLFLESLLDKNITDFIEVTDEVVNDSNFHGHLGSKFKSVDLPYSPESRHSWPVSIYYLIRKLKPQIVVETGVFHGISTCYILQAIKANGKGECISLDLPAYPEEGGYKSLNPYLSDHDRIAQLPPRKEPGWIIPDDLRAHWKLILEKTKDSLPPLMNELKTIDFFLHDSRHSYSNMMFEFKMAYQYLSVGGVLVADNIHWNNSFYDFCNEKKLTPHTYLAYEDPNLKHPFGGIRKK